MSVFLVLIQDWEFGFGRIRNVTPIIRAIRLNERYSTIAPGNRFNPEEIHSAASQFTQYQGYQSRYDRPEKYFWQDMDQAVNSSLRQLNAFDLFYLRDVLNENLGERYQGWDISTGVFFNYSNSLHRVEQTFEDPMLERSKDINKIGGAFAEARWYKNISLKHQIGLEIDSWRSYPLNDDFTEWDTSLLAQINWSWNIVDRFLLKTRLQNRHFRNRTNSDSSSGANTRWRNSSILSADFIYFIENRLAFNVGSNHHLLYRSDSDTDFAFRQRSSSLRFKAGIKYYFSRNLY